MKLFQYNELAYAENIYNYGFQTKHKPTELRLLVLYYRDVLEYPPIKRREELEKFCKKYMLDYCYEQHFNIIDRALRQGTDNKNKLVCVKSVPIYVQEFNYINALKTQYDYKKVVFALLVCKKLKDIIYKTKNRELLSFFNGGKTKYDELKKMAKIPNKLKINEDVICNLKDLKVVNTTHGGRIELSFICDLNNVDEEILFEVEDFENAGYYFDYYNNVKGIKSCKTCGAPFKPRNNNQEFCTRHLTVYEPVKKKIQICVDCGKNFESDNKDRQVERCKSCYKKYRLLYNSKKRMENHYKNKDYM